MQYFFEEEQNSEEKCVTGKALAQNRKHAHRNGELRMLLDTRMRFGWY